MNERVNQVSCV